MARNTQKNEHEIDGKVLYISQPQQKSEKLTIRILVIEVFDGNYAYPAPIVFKNGRIDCLKDIKEGEWVNAQFKLGGFKGRNEGEPKYYAENIGVSCIKG